MRHLTLTLLVMTSAAISVAFAQDGGVHGPPKPSTIIVMPQPTATADNAAAALAGGATAAVFAAGIRISVECKIEAPRLRRLLSTGDAAARGKSRSA